MSFPGAEQPLDPFEAGLIAGRQSAAEQPLTEEQERHIRTLLRQAETQTPPAKAS